MTVVKRIQSFFKRPKAKTKAEEKTSEATGKKAVEREPMVIEGYGEIRTQIIDGMSVETLGSRVANMVAAILHPELTRQKYRVKINEIPDFLKSFEQCLSGKSLEDKESLRKDVEIILRDYPTLLKRAISEDPETRVTIDRELTPKLETIRQVATTKARERADRGDDFDKAYEGEIEKLIGEMTSVILERLYLGE